MRFDCPYIWLNVGPIHLDLGYVCIELGNDLTVLTWDLGVFEIGLFGLGTQCFGLELGLNLLDMQFILFGCNDLALECLTFKYLNY